MIEEVPINSEVNVESFNGEIPPEPLGAEPIIEEPVPKKRGRPFGAKGKAKAAPKVAEARPKKKPRVVEVTPEETASEEELVVKKKTRRRASPEPEPQTPSTQDVALEVMHLLSSRHADRASQRRAKYASWFQ